MKGLTPDPVQPQWQNSWDAEGRQSITLPGHPQTLYGTRKRWLQRGQDKSLHLHGPLCSAAFDDHMEEGNGREETGDRKGGKEAAAPPRHLTPAWGWSGPIPCTRARSSFGTGPTGGGRARACRCGSCLWGTSATALLQGSLTFPPSEQGH